MFGPGRFFRFLFVGFLFLMLFGALRGGAYRSGFAQGYYAGQVETLAGQGESAVPVAPNPRASVYGPAYGDGWGYAGPLGFVGGVFKFFFTLLLVGFVFKLLMFGRWRRWHGDGRHHHSDWKGPHGKWKHHRNGKHDGPKEKSPEDVEPDIRTV